MPLFYIIILYIMPFKKAVKKVPTVTVETKKVDDCCDSKSSCCMPAKCHGFKSVQFILIVLNTLTLICIAYNQRNIESMRVGGKQNYGMVKQIYQSEGFKAQQKQQIEQALQMFQKPAAETQAQPQVNVQPNQIMSGNAQ
jgi:hypothetical protein